MAKFKVGDRVKYKGNHPKIRGKSGTVSFVGIPGDDPTYLTVDMDNGEEWGAPEKDWAFMNSRAANAVAPELRRATKLRLKENFADEYGSYHKGDVFQVYTYQFSPHHAILVVPGREVTLEVPWDKVEVANSCRSTNAVVANALNASCVARNGYVDVYTIAKQEWNRAYRGNEPFGVDAEIKPNGDFKIQEVAHGKVDDSDVDWNPIADKVKRALLAAGNKSAVVKVNPYGNGIVGNIGIARNAMRDNGDVLVEFTTLGASGMERVSKRMTSTAFRDWLVKTGNGAQEQGIWNELMKGDNASFLHGGIKVSVKAL